MLQVQSAVRWSASRMKSELHPIKSHVWDGLPRLARNFLRMDDSFERLDTFRGVASSMDSNEDTV